MIGRCLLGCYEVLEDTIGSSLFLLFGGGCFFALYGGILGRIYIGRNSGIFGAVGAVYARFSGVLGVCRLWVCFTVLGVFLVCYG